MEAILKDAGINVTTEGIDAMADAREIKTRDEIECIRMACAIGEAALYQVRKAIAPGVRESDLVGIMNKVATECGGTAYGDSYVSLSGPNTSPNIRAFTDRMIRPGDVVFVDAAGIHFLEYHTCYYRTFVCGKAWAELKEALKKTAYWQRDPLEKCRDGATTKDIAERFAKAAEWGYEDETKAMGNSIAHGIGLSHIERPFIHREFSLDYPMPIKEGMVFAIENQFPDGFGQGVRLEDVVAVTKTGYELLTRWPLEIVECPY
jgi:Xaa-Pro dipeptidase